MSLLRSISTVFLLVLTLFFFGNAFSQQATTPVDGKEVSLVSKVLGEERVLSVSLPPGYLGGEHKFPVLYVLDGRAHGQHASAAVEFLSRYGRMPQMIVVAVYNVDRNRDFSPAVDPRLPTSGGAGKFLGFVADELTPYIDEQYRTSGYSVIMGHSFGGTFVTYALLEKPALFDAYIVVSPYMQYVDNYLVKEAGTKLRSSYDTTKQFYMTVGDEPEYIQAIGEFHSLVREKSGQAINIEYVRMGAEDHTTIPYLSMFNGLRHIFSDWVLPDEAFEQGLAAIDAHYAKISHKYGFDTPTPESELNRLGYTYLGNDEFEKAIEVLTENTIRYPRSANVFDSLGEAYETNGQLELAKGSYTKAVEMATAQGQVNTAIYEANLDRVSGKEKD